MSGVTSTDLLTGAATIITDNNLGVVIAATTIVGIFGVLFRRLVRSVR